ncbi:amino acid ABC transporter ATP-binding protein [Oculatella sp. LEGE 06141]|uniref:amino acid ABC transporter ATP-binding protein n=1 Tax=Oculatella sp. LEGE 06141 TaxID=1828648 RepID=UPI001881BA8D|nr:amino acid ABC transporter ATP-binding protein [Oculatella sp. LEGE 06141]MBE9178951.1 amino acid ABC transporter ATP-binding protein [Oculatella sp. LEGE 06141]
MLNTEIDTDTIPAVHLLYLCKKFGRHEVLTDINLKVVPGETVCLLGPSGSGKSTLLRCINFLETSDFGEIFLHGTRVAYGRSAGKKGLTEAELAKLRTRVSMVFQHFNLWPHMTVLGNIVEAPIHVQKRPRAQVIAEAEALLLKVGLLDKRDVYPSRLSGGQKQRVAIARALAMKSDVILFDEPTSSLDPELVGEVLSVIKQLAEDGMTMIIATHEMDFAREVASRVVFLDGGRVLESGEPKAFFRRPTTERARQFLERYVR